MKALTLTQPWASLVAMGVKTIETRSWSTRYRGPLAIHAAVAMPPEAISFAVEERAAHGWLPPYVDLPRGAIVAVVELLACVRTEDFDPGGPTRQWEDGYGDFSPGRFAWVFAREDGRRIELPAPIPCRGALGLWDVPADVAALLPALTEAVTR